MNANYSKMSSGGFDPPHPARIRLEMLPLHYNDSV